MSNESTQPPPEKPSEKIFPNGREFLKERGLPPPWRQYGQPDLRGSTHVIGEAEREAIVAALYLRRPLLVTGNPGVGKSSLAYAVAAELGLGPVLVWPITSRTVLQHGLYSYDAVGRFQETGSGGGNIGKYLSLGPLGTGLVDSTESDPRVVLIDELDKSDVDLPNDLLHVLEEGRFLIPELERYPEEKVEISLHGGTGRKSIEKGLVQAGASPFILMTSNGEREFPPAFLRRCLRLSVQPPTSDQLKEIVRLKLREHQLEQSTLDALVRMFGDIQRGTPPPLLATDQLLNAAFLVAARGQVKEAELRRLILTPLQ